MFLAYLPGFERRKRYTSELARLVDEFGEEVLMSEAN